MTTNAHILIFILIFQSLIFAGGTVAAEGNASQITAGKSWDWQLTEPYNLDREVEIFDLDLDEMDVEKMSAFKSRNIATICYVSVGTLEEWRNDFDDFPASIIGRTYGDWPDEKFLDIRQLDFILPLMKARFERCAELGFDAIEPDNMDVYDNESGFDISVEDSMIYFKALAREAHQLGMKIAQKNVPSLSAKLSDIFDFVISESCYQDEFCDAFLPYINKGKAVLDAEYNDRPIDFDAACAFAAKNNISMILKGRDLSRDYKGCPSS